MRELFNSLPKNDYDSGTGLPLVDTCFFIYSFEKDREREINDFRFAMTSFNVEELLHVMHRLHENVKKDIRKFLHHHRENLSVLALPIHPGNKQHEVDFVDSVDSELLHHCHDPSDAVLLAAAIKTKSDIYTRDKHHLYTGELENFLRKYGIQVFNKIGLNRPSNRV
jgi:predicted nucleic acid-binding protein